MCVRVGRRSVCAYYRAGQFVQGARLTAKHPKTTMHPLNRMLRTAFVPHFACAE